MSPAEIERERALSKAQGEQIQKEFLAALKANAKDAIEGKAPWQRGEREL